MIVIENASPLENEWRGICISLPRHKHIFKKSKCKKVREFRLRRIFLLAALVSELPSPCSQNANPYSWRKRHEWGLARSASAKKKKEQQSCSFFFFGDPYGNRTHVSSVRG